MAGDKIQRVGLARVAFYDEGRSESVRGKGPADKEPRIVRKKANRGQSGLKLTGEPVWLFVVKPQVGPQQVRTRVPPGKQRGQSKRDKRGAGTSNLNALFRSPAGSFSQDFGLLLCCVL